MNESEPSIAILGASGLIGQAAASQLGRMGLPVVPIARHFGAAQWTSLGPGAVKQPIVDLDRDSLARLLSERNIDIVVNCVGVLQDSRRGGDAANVHSDFTARLVQALHALERPCLLIHLSVPGREEDDRTAFSRTKREAERQIAHGSIPFVILRPGFVVAPAAFGGSALIRALASLPFDLPDSLAPRPFAAADIRDIVRTIAHVAHRWREGERQWNAVWDVMERHPHTVGQVIGAFREHLGAGPGRLRLPNWLMGAGAKAGDIVAHLGWSPPIRSTALDEMRRGVDGDPAPWIAATGLEPTPLRETLAELPASVQEKWFARLYLVKPLILAMLAMFWIATGLIVLAAAFDAATAMLTERGFPLILAIALTASASLADILIGIAIAFRRTCRAGLLAGIGLSLLYMLGAAIIAPELWIEPLGALVKTGPAIVLMLVALAILDER